eukprot:3241186-Amphidinium_carterae.2
MHGFLEHMHHQRKSYLRQVGCSLWPGKGSGKSKSSKVSGAKTVQELEVPVLMCKKTFLLLYTCTNSARKMGVWCIVEINWKAELVSEELHTDKRVDLRLQVGCLASRVSMIYGVQGGSI